MDKADHIAKRNCSNFSSSFTKEDRSFQIRKPVGGAVADVACVCMNTTYRRKLHIGWVQCDVCDRYCHITCAGKCTNFHRMGAMMLILFNTIVAKYSILLLLYIHIVLLYFVTIQDCF